MAMEFLDEATDKLHTQRAVLKVIGLGGGGGNAVNHMARQSNSGVEFICANTDSQALNDMDVDKVICMGMKTATQGLGAGMRVEVGEAAAEEDREAIKEVLVGTDMLFIAAGMGGGTGTGAAPVIAAIAKEAGILTVAVVSRPFSWEGDQKTHIADKGIDKLLGQVDSLIILPNDKLEETLDEETLDDMDKVFAASDDVLTNAVTSITELIIQTGRINIDFADVKTVMSTPGKAMMGSGIASGENRAKEAVDLALSNPLIEGVDLNNAQGILVNVTGKKFGMKDLKAIGEHIKEYVAQGAFVKVGNGICEDIPDGAIKVTVVATGLSGERVIAETPEVHQKHIVDDSDFIKPAEIQDFKHRSKDINTAAYLRKQIC
jgi:cell division protein FtsZ